MPHLTLIGCGKMGAALARAWVTRGLSTTVIEPQDIPNDIHAPHIRSVSDLKTAPDIVVLAVKPQMMADVLRDVRPHITAQTLVISIAAGQSLAGMGAALHTGQPIIRSMPNLPASIGVGITALVANAPCTPDHRAQAEALLQAAGKTVWIEDEAQMDAVTALSGSGPAYVFLLVEAMAQAGIAAGLPADMAMNLARETVIGSAALLHAEPTISATTLRENVTSKGGTTAAALDILMQDESFQTLMTRAVLAARDRSKALSV